MKCLVHHCKGPNIGKEIEIADKTEMTSVGRGHTQRMVQLGEGICAIVSGVIAPRLEPLVPSFCIYWPNPKQADALS